MQEKKDKILKMSFKDYYKSLSEIQYDLKSRVINKLNISEKTFYNKMNDESWSQVEIEAIESIKVEMAKNLSSLC